ncbi:hypothetical protein E4U55_002869 [Claviceps digitariae]|nr:hypothetical protein E4U55_002869 [Claviceps digitariae]
MRGPINFENARHQWHCAHGLSRDDQKKPLSQDEQQQALQEREKFLESSYFGRTYHDQGLLTLDRSLYRRFDSCRPGAERIIIRPISPSETAKWPVDSSKLGNLEKLPVELMNMMLSDLDLAALHCFKAVSRRAFRIVDAHPQVRLLVEEAQQIMRGFFAVKLASTVTVRELFTQLQKSRCVECGDFGGYMYMFTLERVCAWCVERTTRFSVVRERDALEKFGLSLETLESMPHLESFPPRVFGDGPDEGLYLPLFDRASVIEAAKARAESDGSVPPSTTSVDPNDVQSYKDKIEKREIQHDKMRFRKRRADEIKRRERSQKKKVRDDLRRIELQRKLEEKKAAGIALTPSDDDYDGSSTDDNTDHWPEMQPGEDALPRQLRKLKDLEPEEVALTKALQKAKDDRKNFEERVALNQSGVEPRCLIAVHRAPWLNMKTQTAEWGFHCLFCLEKHLMHCRSTPSANAKAMYFRRDFLVSTFEEHMDEFDPMRNGKHQRDACCREGLCGTDSGFPCRTCSGSNRKEIRHEHFWLS